jgi:hypothetical protein
MTDPAPEYVHDILDAYLGGELINFAGHEVPADVQARLAKAFNWDRKQELALRQLESPATGYVRPSDPPVRCDSCGRLVHYWELHHLDPKGWGGDPSQLLVDRQVVWVRICGDCHSTAHMILDTFKPRGVWDDLWLNGYATPIPHGIVEVARRGWNLYQKRLALPTTEAT